MTDEFAVLLSIGLGALFAVVVIYALRRWISAQAADRRPQGLVPPEQQAPASTALGRIWQTLNRPIWRPRR